MVVVHNCLYMFIPFLSSSSFQVWQYLAILFQANLNWQYLAISGNSVWQYIYHSQPWTSASWESFEVAPLQPLSSPLRSSRSFRPVSWGRGDMVSTATWSFQQGTKWWKMMKNDHKPQKSTIGFVVYPWIPMVYQPFNRFARCRFAALHFGSLQKLLVRRLNGLIRLLIVGCQRPVGNQEPTPPQYPAGFLGRVTAIAVLGWIGKLRLRQFMIINMNQRLFPDIMINLNIMPKIWRSIDGNMIKDTND